MAATETLASFSQNVCRRMPKNLLSLVIFVELQKLESSITFEWSIQIPQLKGIKCLKLNFQNANLIVDLGDNRSVRQTLADSLCNAERRRLPSLAFLDRSVRQRDLDRIARLLCNLFLVLGHKLVKKYDALLDEIRPLLQFFGRFIVWLNICEVKFKKIIEIPPAMVQPSP